MGFSLDVILCGVDVLGLAVCSASCPISTGSDIFLVLSAVRWRNMSICSVIQLILLALKELSVKVTHCLLVVLTLMGRSCIRGLHT